MGVYLLDKEKITFPSPGLADEDGLLAIGGDLCVKRLLLAYTNGIFPWYNPGEDILWWCPKERFIIRPDRIHISHSMKKYMKRHNAQVHIDGDFEKVIHMCRKLREESGTWITDEMEEAYCRMHDKGYAMSVEAYTDGELAGGLYGVCIGRCFFGESMFSVKENGSKIALIALAKFCSDNNFSMIDCQMHTDHLESMGGEMISYDEYMKLVNIGLER